MIRRVTAATALAVLLGVVFSRAAAQQPAPPQDQPAAQQQPVFRAGATLVRVDVTVVDHDGNPDASLTADDFEVEEDGVPQKVEACKLVSATGRPPAGDDVSLAIRSREHAAAEAARDDVRVFLIFWDEYHIDQFASALRGREALGKFVTTAFGPTDLVALMDPLTPVDALDFTRDWSALSDKIRRLKGRLGVYIPTRSSAEDAMLERGGDIARIRTEVTMSALKSAAVHLGSLREGRKSIIFVSDGFALPGDMSNDLEDLIQTANNNNTAVYTLDPRGMVEGVADVLRSLAINTGADAIVNANQPLGPLKQVVKEASAYYLIGYTPTRAPADDGKFHQIRVRVKKPRLDVRARRGYWAPSEAEIAKAASDTDAAAVPAPVARALGTLATGRPDQTIDIWTGTSLGSDGTPQVAVAWAPRSGRAMPGRGGTFSVSLPAAGKQTFDAPVEARHLSFPAAPGSLQLKFTTRDSAGDVVEEETRTIEVPNFPAQRLAIPSPVILRAQNVGEFRALSADADPIPYAGHDFVRTDRLLVRFTLYGNAGNAKIEARLMTSKQSALVSLPVAPVKDQPGHFQIDLPLASVARGDFLISIEATSGDDRATALVPLRVVS